MPRPKKPPTDVAPERETVVAKVLADQRGRVKCRVTVIARDPCRKHYPEPCTCEKPLVGVYDNPADLFTQQYAQLTQLNIFDTAETIRDTSNATHAETANTACTAVTIYAGTGSTTVTVTDFALQTPTENVAGTVNAYSGSGASGSFTITGTITAGAARTYAEVGLQVTCNTHLYLVCHDNIGPFTVSSGGTLAVTYTMTYS
jgi:hypothetical protein